MSNYDNISNNNSTVGIIALVIIEMCMLWLVKDCVSAIIISHKVITAGVLNFKMAASHFRRFFQGSDECYSRKFSFKGHKRCYSEFCKTLFKSLFLIKLNVLKILAYLNTSNHHNCNKIWVMLYLFTVDFKSTWVIILKQSFASGPVNTLWLHRDYSTTFTCLQWIIVNYLPDFHNLI